MAKYLQKAPSPYWANEMAKGHKLPAGMRQCYGKSCHGRWQPSNYFGGRKICWECWLAGLSKRTLDGWGPSRSIVA